MFELILSLFSSDLGKWAMSALAIIGGALGLYGKGRSDGKKVAKVDNYEANHAALGKANQVKRKTASESDDEIDKAAKKWTR